MIWKREQNVMQKREKGGGENGEKVEVDKEAGKIEIENRNE